MSHQAGDTPPPLISAPSSVGDSRVRKKLSGAVEALFGRIANEQDALAVRLAALEQRHQAAEERTRARLEALERADAARGAQLNELSEALAANEAQIVEELIECQGTPVDLGGYWKPDFDKVDKAMRASPTFNKILDA